MSEIKSVRGPDDLVVIEPSSSARDSLWIGVRGETRTAGTSVPRADFLDAIRTELDVIVIQRSELPEVEASGRHAWPIETRPPSPYDDAFNSVGATGPNCPNGKPEWHRGRALAHLALAEHLDAHPPVDEAQVEALAGLMKQLDYMRPETYARELVQRGVRVEVKP